MAKKTNKDTANINQLKESDYIFRPKSVPKNVEKDNIDNDKQEEYFDIKGKSVSAGNKDVVAKKIIIKSRMQHYILIGPNGTPYDPIGMYDKGTLGKEKGGKPLWDFMKVRKDSFDTYIKYLSERNKAYFNNLLRGL